MSVPNGVWPEILFFLSFLRYSWCTEKSSCNVETLTMERLIVNHFLDNWPFHVKPNGYTESGLTVSSGMSVLNVLAVNPLSCNAMAINGLSMTRQLTKRQEYERK